MPVGVVRRSNKHMMMKSAWRDEKGIILIWFYLLIVVLLITGGSLYGLSFQESRLISVDQARDKAFYLAEAGLDRKLQELRSGDQNSIVSTSLGDGSYSVTYDAQTKQIRATGTVNGIPRTLIAMAVKLPPPGVQGAISSVGNAAFSSITIDGRDHDSTGTLISGQPGTYGVSSGGTINPNRGTLIGGNGFEPSNPSNPAAIQQNVANVPTTPEAVLGLQPGSLDQYKTSNPPAITPDNPLNGILYVTANNLNNPNFGTQDNPSRGILIVHNADGDARIKNAEGHFKGIIIADDIVHIQSDVIVTGALVLQKASGTTVGYENTQVKYSSEVLSNLPTSTYSIVAWEDTQNTPYIYS